MNMQRALKRAKDFTPSQESSGAFAEFLNKQTTLFSGVTIDGKTIDGVMTEKEMIERIKTSHQSAEDQLTNFFNLKTGILWTNMKTKVEVGVLGELTVMEAVVYRDNVLPLLKAYVNQIESEHRQAVQVNVKLLEKYEQRLDTMVKNSSGDGKTITKEEVAVLEGLCANSKPTLHVDMAQLDSLKLRIRTIEEDLDVALSSSNALTGLLKPLSDDLVE